VISSAPSARRKSLHVCVSTRSLSHLCDFWLHWKVILDNAQCVPPAGRACLCSFNVHHVSHPIYFGKYLFPRVKLFHPPAADLTSQSLRPFRLVALRAGLRYEKVTQRALIMLLLVSSFVCLLMIVCVSFWISYRFHLSVSLCLLHHRHGKKVKRKEKLLL
jgi:hypothetical protein